MMKASLIALAALFAATGASLATSSRWQDSEGGSVRLVTSGLPDVEGTLKGALQIRLKPGWKTYWRDPGGNGVPPQLDTSPSTNVKSAQMMYPAPKRIDDGNAQTAGYDTSLALPIVFSLNEAANAAEIRANVFLGICKEICIPVQADFKIDPAADPENADDGAIVEHGFSELPAEARDDFRVDSLHIDGKSLVATAKIPSDSEKPVLFLASADGYLLGLPEREKRDGDAASFAAEIFQKPDGSKPAQFHYTLVAGKRSVSGTATLR